MNKPLRRIAIFCGILVLALLIRDNWLQYVRADELNSHKYNRRVEIERYAHERGDIIVDGKAITGSVETEDSDFTYKRVWKNGPLWAPVTGYSSQAFDSSQLENLEDGILTGNDDQLFFDRTLSMFTGDKKRGGNIVTTLNGDAQKAAFKGLGEKKGAVVALDPKSGAILALASTPSYDPSVFAGNSLKDSDNRQKLLKDQDKPMLNRALRETYPRAPPSRSSPPPPPWRTGSTTTSTPRRTRRCPGRCRSPPRSSRTRATSPARTPRCARPCGCRATPSSER